MSKHRGYILHRFVGAPARSDYERQLSELKRKRLDAMMPTAMPFVKNVLGVMNTASWLVCLEAYELIKPLKERLDRNVKGGGTIRDEFEEVFKALKQYERNIIHSSDGFFSTLAMDDEIRKRYATEGLTNEKLYDFWFSYGSISYDKNKNFLSCLANKLKLIYKANHIENAEAAAWSMCACAILGLTTDAYDGVMNALPCKWGGSRREWQRRLAAFSISHVEKLWIDAHRDMFPGFDQLNRSDFESANVQMSIDQWVSRQIGDKNFRECWKQAIADYADDIFRTEGCAKAAIQGITEYGLY